MYSKTAFFFITAGFFAVSVTANPITTVTAIAPGPTVTSANQCNTGDLSCCNTVQSSTSSSTAALLGLLGIVLGDVTGLVGLGCTSISLANLGGGCNAQAVCCTGNTFNGLINLGCTPVSL